ncbi:MAG: hypothetical protein JXB32_10030 [Deltaproteobacteria bacterium]|nr:hypothetical protein [Deltaproteobacteria bacterium]
MSDESNRGGEAPDPADPQPVEDAPFDPSDLSPDERAVVPEDTPFRRLLEDRRVRLALIAGLPLFAAVLIAVAILAQSIGIARSVVVDGPTTLAPGATTAVRVSYDEMDDYGLPHEIPLQRVRLELCLGGKAGVPAGVPAGRVRRDDRGRSCVTLGERAVPDRGHDVEVGLEVPAVPDGEHPVRIELQTDGEQVAYEFPVRVTAAALEPLPRDNGRAPLRPLGRSGVAVDLVPSGGGVLRGRTSNLLLRAVGPDGFPHSGTLWLLGIGELAQGGLPETVTTDAVGLASVQLRAETFEYRLAVSTVPYPVMDPLEAELGLLPENVLDRTALVEIGYQPILGQLEPGVSADAAGDRPFLRAGGPLAVAFVDGAGPRMPLQAELWRQGRLLAVAAWPAEAPAATFEQPLPEGLSFVQVHRPAGAEDGVVGRHVWGGADAGPSVAELRALLAALDWPPGDQAWVSAARQVLDELGEAERSRLGRYVLGRRDAIWYPAGVLFDSRPTDRARATSLREGIKTAMAWAIGGLALVLVGGAVVLGAATVRHRRRQRGLGDVVRSTASLDGEAPISMYDRAPWWVQHAVFLRIAVVLLILALALGAIAVLVWGMRQTYW